MAAACRAACLRMRIPRLRGLFVPRANGSERALTGAGSCLHTVTVVHLDTYHLLEYAFDGKDAPVSSRLFRRIGGRQFRVVVTQTVLGEALAVMIRKCSTHERLMGCIGRMIYALRMCRVEAARCLEAFDPEITGIISELRKRAVLLDGTDMLVLAQALADEDCEYLLTRDSMLIRSEGIMEYAEELRTRRRKRAKPEVRYIL